MMRLDKYLCETGFGTRSEVKAFLKKGMVTVDGETVKKSEQKIDENTARVVCNGQKAVYAAFTYIMLHKPAGVVSATEDKRERTVLDLLDADSGRDLFPVGRLDKDTEGLLLLTNDGGLAHDLLSPRKHVDKTYYARIEGKVTEAHVRQFQEGLDIKEKHLTLPAKLQILKSSDESEILVTIQEGRFHQVKRMFQAVDCRVIFLKRMSMGSLVLDESLRPGQYRHLTEKEIKDLKEQS
ncbi:MAG: rRNA pseudouridine synthase [Clostridiales bacterium]|nr:rRNA pseudouridine synthase [Clostridiales bacterium]